MNKASVRRKSAGNSRSNTTNSNSRVSMTRRASKIATLEKEKNVAKIRVVSEEGKDVTPESLFTGTPHDRASQIQLDETSSSNDFRSMASIFQSGIANTQVGASIFAPSVLGSSRTSIIPRSISQGGFSSVGSGESVAMDKRTSICINTETRVQRDEHYFEELSPQDLEKEVLVTFDETETITTFRIFARAVQEETENVEIIKEQNDQYLELCANREGNDKYVCHEMQTFNNALKEKQTNTVPVNVENVASQASKSILWDAYNDPKDSVVERKRSIEEVKLGVSEATLSNGPSSVLGRSSHGSSEFNERVDITQDQISKRHEQILTSESLQQSLLLVERIISQNNYQKKISLYRGLPELDYNGNLIQEEGDGEMKLNKLWSFQSAVTKPYSVTDISWNKVNPDIIAVSYGLMKNNVLNSKDDTGGVVCCWNIKNLEHPERVYHTNSTVLSVSFSKMSSNLLAVALYSGVIHIYNVARKEDVVAIDSYDSAGKHTGQTWKLNWVERERGNDERGEVLVSVAHDGRVMQWTIRKGFESLDLMKIKRYVKPRGTAKTSKSEHARISIYAPALSFDFHPSDGNSYLVGTEEGVIHRCSCSYNEQTLDVYNGHGGPVYCVRWHPTLEHVFASCSEDWTIRIWIQRETKHVIKLDNGTKPIRDLQWSKYSENLILAITDSSIDVWDLTVSILDPVMSMAFHSGCELTNIGISPNSNCLLVGDSDGTVSVYQIKGFQRDTAANVVELIEATLKSYNA